MTCEKLSPIANPICKLIVCKDCAVGYSGETYYLPDVLSLRSEVNDFDEFVARLTGIHRTSDERIDFLLAEIGQRNLVKIASGRAERIEAGYIGSFAAFEELQKQRHQPAQDEATVLNLVMLPECPPSQSAVYSKDLSAFNLALQNEASGAGGFAVPFLIDTQGHRFGTYCTSIRRPLAWHEFSIGMHRVIDWQGAPEGAFSVNFAGGGHGFACHIRQCNLGIEAHYPVFGIETRKHKEPEWSFRQKMDTLRGIKMTKTAERHLLDYIFSANAFRCNGRFNEARAEVSSAIAFILDRCTDQSGNKLDDQYEFAYLMFENYQSVNLPLEYAGYLIECIRLRYQLASGGGSEEEIGRALRDYELIQNANKASVLWSKGNPNGKPG